MGATDLLERRSKRLGELIEMAAPIRMICAEVMLVTESAISLNPSFKSQLLLKLQEGNDENIAS